MLRNQGYIVDPLHYCLQLNTLLLSADSVSSISLYRYHEKQVPSQVWLPFKNQQSPVYLVSCHFLRCTTYSAIYMSKWSSVQICANNLCNFL